MTYPWYLTMILLKTDGNSGWFAREHQVSKIPEQNYFKKAEPVWWKKHPQRNSPQSPVLEKVFQVRSATKSTLVGFFDITTIKSDCLYQVQLWHSEVSLGDNLQQMIWTKVPWQQGYGI